MDSLLAVEDDEEESLVELDDDGLDVEGLDDESLLLEESPLELPPLLAFDREP